MVTYSSIAKKALDTAGHFAAKHFDKHIKYQEKGKQDTVTEIDIAIHNQLTQYLEKKTGIPVLSEEEHKPEIHDTCWILDPIDGTNNYLRGIPFCTISLALRENKEIVLGGVTDFLRSQRYFAEKNNGSKCNSKKIYVSETSNLKRSLIITEPGHLPNQRNTHQLKYIKQNCLGFRSFGSSALDLCMIAAGHSDAAILMYPYIWDIAAGALILKESGGKLHGFTTKSQPLLYPLVVASNRKIHSKILSNIKQ